LDSGVHHPMHQGAIPRIKTIIDNQQYA